MFITQRTYQHQTVFDVCERASDGRATVVRTLYVCYARTTLTDGTPWHIIYNEGMEPIHEISRYLNIGLKEYSDATVTRKVTALRLLVAFCTAYGFRDFFIPELYCGDFNEFLRRDDRAQSSSTREYFSDVREFLEYTGHVDDPLLTHSTRTAWLTGADGEERPTTYKDYKHAPKKNSDKGLMCPAHNSLEDFAAILKTMQSATEHGPEGDLAGCVIVYLMFKLGRRIGEVLGLTLEDLSTIVSTETGEVRDCLIFRNRLSDRTGQSAKNRMHPENVSAYRSRDYINLSQSSRNCIVLEKDVHDMLKSYIDYAHPKAQTNHPEHYAGTVADIVDPVRFRAEWGLPENHYIFLNDWGGVLRKEAWNKRLRVYYERTGIPYGNGKSINHSWRHTTAWLMRHRLHMTSHEIADYLGHKNINTVEIYARADYDTIGRLSHKVQQYINHEIQSLTNGQPDDK